MKYCITHKINFSLLLIAISLLLCTSSKTLAQEPEMQQENIVEQNNLPLKEPTNPLQQEVFSPQQEPEKPENIQPQNNEAPKPTLELNLLKPQATQSENIENVYNLSQGAKNLLNSFQIEKIKSLMYNEKDARNINNAINSSKGYQSFVLEGQEKPDEIIAATEEKQDNVRAYIYLASILYFDKNNWTIWIGNKKITNKNNNPDNELYITSISPSRVSVLWSLSISHWKLLFGVQNDDLLPPINEKNQIETRFTIRPNQTFVLTTNKVLEGHVVPATTTNNSSENTPN